MTMLSQVPGGAILPDPDTHLRRTIGLIGHAIEEGWAAARTQIKEAGFGPRIIQTAFPQYLVHHVMHEIHQLGSTSDEVETFLIPNRRRTSHHVVVRFGNFWTTVSAVKSQSDRPRPARFRSDYSQRQMRFVIDESTNRFQVAPLPEASHKIHTYIQMLHGPTPENRQVHGFTLIAFTNHFGEYEPNPINILEFVGPENEYPRGAPEEPVPENFGLQLKQMEPTQCL